MVYVLVVVPSPAVTTVLMVLVPISKAILAEADPLVTVTPFTFMLAVPSDWMGVRVIELLANGTVVV
jgi:hypothetical protein